MAGVKNNRRVQYTKQVIKQSFLKILEEKDISKVSVKEICELADVNRGTFYLHYQDTNDLFNQIEDELIASVMPILQIEGEGFIHVWLSKLIHLLNENRTVSRIILTDYQNSRLVKNVFAEVQNMAMHDFSKDFKENDPRILNFYFVFFVQGSIGTILEWLKDDAGVSEQELTDALTKVLERISILDLKHL